MYLITEYQLQQLVNSDVHMNRKDVFDEIKSQQINFDGNYTVLAKVRAFQPTIQGYTKPIDSKRL